MSGTVDVLSPHHRPILAGFALSNVLLAFDYDGTLAPIATTPAAAKMRSTTERLLARASRRYPCVVISGRMLADISQRVQEIPLWYVFGNHGFEPVSPDHAAEFYDAKRDEIFNKRHGSPRRPRLADGIDADSPLRKLLDEIQSIRADMRFREDGLHATVTVRRK